MAKRRVPNPYISPAFAAFPWLAGVMIAPEEEEPEDDTLAAPLDEDAAPGDYDRPAEDDQSEFGPVVEGLVDETLARARAEEGQDARMAEPPPMQPPMGQPPMPLAGQAGPPMQGQPPQGPPGQPGQLPPPPFVGDVGGVPTFMQLPGGGVGPLPEGANLLPPMSPRFPPSPRTARPPLPSPGQERDRQLQRALGYLDRQRREQHRLLERARHKIGMQEGDERRYLYKMLNEARAMGDKKRYALVRDAIFQSMQKYGAARNSLMGREIDALGEMSDRATNLIDRFYRPTSYRPLGEVLAAGEQKGQYGLEGGEQRGKYRLAAGDQRLFGQAMTQAGQDRRALLRHWSQLVVTRARGDERRKITEQTFQNQLALLDRRLRASGARTIASAKASAARSAMISKMRARMDALERYLEGNTLELTPEQMTGMIRQLEAELDRLADEAYDKIVESGAEQAEALSGGTNYHTMTESQLKRALQEAIAAGDRENAALIARIAKQRGFTSE